VNTSTSAPPKTNGSAATPAAAPAAAPAGEAPQPPLFYSRPLPLSEQYHATVKIRPEGDFSFAAETSAIPLSIPEFALAARHYPIIFIGEDLIPSMAVGLRPSNNLFVDVKGAWEIGQYIPAYVRRFPFILMGDQSDERLRLGIDDDARSTKEGARALFADGKETDVLRQGMELCEQFHTAYRFSTECMQAIKAADITEPQSLEVTLPGGEKLNVGAFVAVKEEKFRALPDATILEWRTKGWLHAIYFHLQSLNNWEALLARTANRMAAAAALR